MTWAFIWMMFVLKIPIAGLLWIVWRAIASTPEAAQGEAPLDSGGGDGGPHPRPRVPRPPRRGEHDLALPQPPARVRAVAGSTPVVR
ncbi:MAG: hypothetical protein ACJ76Z_14340 [Thermoleophilaceae bacterium]